MYFNWIFLIYQYPRGRQASGQKMPHIITVSNTDPDDVREFAVIFLYLTPGCCLLLGGGGFKGSLGIFGIPLALFWFPFSLGFLCFFLCIVSGILFSYFASILLVVFALWCDVLPFYFFPLFSRHVFLLTKENLIGILEISCNFSSLLHFKRFPSG